MSAMERDEQNADDEADEASSEANAPGDRVDVLAKLREELRATREAMATNSRVAESTAAARAIPASPNRTSPVLKMLGEGSMSKMLRNPFVDLQKSFNPSASLVSSLAQTRQDILALSRAPSVASLITNRPDFGYTVSSMITGRVRAENTILGMASRLGEQPWRKAYDARRMILGIHESTNALMARSVLPMIDVSEKLKRFQTGLLGDPERWQSILRGPTELMARIAERMQLEQEVEDHAEAFVTRHGWPIPMTLPLRLRIQLVRGGATMTSDEVEAQLLQACAPTSDALGGLWLTLADAEIMASRRHILDEAYAAYMRGEYHSAIYTLLPQIEGVMVDASFDPEERPSYKRPQRAASKLVSPRGFAPVLFEGLIMVAEQAMGRRAMFATYEPYVYTFHGEPEGLNRHAILHGDSRRFGTAANALWLLLVLVAVVEHIELANRIVEVEVEVEAPIPA